MRYRLRSAWIRHGGLRGLHPVAIEDHVDRLKDSFGTSEKMLDARLGMTRMGHSVRTTLRKIEGGRLAPARKHIEKHAQRIDAYWHMIGASAFASFGVLALLVTGYLVINPIIASGPSSNRVIAYQLHLADSNSVPVGGSKDLKITFFDAVTAGNQLYTYCATTDSPTGTPESLPVTFTNGLATVLIGDTAITCNSSGFEQVIPASLFSNTEIWMEVDVAGETLVPRKRLVASGYALNADLLDDLDTSAVGGAGAYVPVTDGSGNFTITGRSSFNTTTKNGQIHIKEDTATVIYDADIMVDGTFDTACGGANWTCGTDWSIAAGTLTKVAGSDEDLAHSDEFSVTAGETYEVTFDVTTTTIGSLYPMIGDGAIVFSGIGGNPGVTLGSSTYTTLIDITTTDTTAHFYFMPYTGDWAGTIDNVVLKKVNFYTPALTVENDDGDIVLEIRAGFASGSGSQANTFIGYKAGRSAEDSASYNTALGIKVMQNLSTGIWNTGIGERALSRLTTADYNVALGGNAMASVTTGHRSVGIGVSALSQMTGAYNTSVGHNSMVNSSSADRSISLGAYAMEGAYADMTTGDDNIAIGYRAMTAMKTGYSNSVLGNYAGDAITTGYQNLGLGYGSLGALTTGYRNVALGFQSGDALTTGNNNILIGYDVAAPAVGSVSKLNIGDTIYGDLAAGSVGIGTSSPITQLHVPGKLPTSAAGSVATDTGPAWVDAQGQYAYVVNFGVLFGTPGDTMQIFDISDPASPTLVGSATTKTHPHSIAVQGQYAYVTNFKFIAPDETYLEVFDVSDPTNPVSVGKVIAGLDAMSLFVQGKYAYVGAYTSSWRFNVFDISDPTNPQRVGTAESADPIGTIWGVFVKDKYLYSTHMTSNKFSVYDVSDPTDPVRLDTIGTADGLSTDPAHVYVQDSYAYVTFETNNNLQVIDVSDPATPTVVGTVATNGSGSYGLSVQGRYAYVANYNGNTISVVDVSNPVSPSLVGTIATGTNPQGLNVHGRYAYVVNRGSNTMQVFDLGGSYIQQMEAGGIETGTLAVQNNIRASEADISGGLGVGRSARINEGLSVGGDANIVNDLFIGGDGLLHSGNMTTAFGGLGRYENHLIYSEQFDNSAWTATGVSVTADTVASPGGSTTADTIADDATASGDVTQNDIAAAAGETFTFSVWIRNNDTDHNIRIRIQDDGTTPDETYETFKPTTSWKRHTVTHTASAGTTNVDISIMDISVASPAEANNSFYAWGAQLEKQSSSGVYARTESTAMTTTGNGFVTGADGPHLFLSGNVGVGTTTPDATLNVNQPTITQGSFFDTGNAPFTVSKTFTEFGRGALIQSVWDFPSDGFGIYGMEVGAQTKEGNSNNMTGSVVGFIGRAEHLGTGNASWLTGVLGVAGARDNGGDVTGNVIGVTGTGLAGTNSTIAQSVGLKAYNMASGSGAVITDSYAIIAHNPYELSGGVITNNVGLQIDEMTVGNNNTDFLIGTLTIPTGNFGVYNASSYNNYFASNVGIGDSTPASLFTVGSGDMFRVDSSGNITTLGDLAVEGGDITTTTATFNLVAGATTVNIAGGSSSTGCTVDGSGNLTCSGSLSGSGGSGGWVDGGTDVYLATLTDKVGIGTTTPTSRLTVQSSSSEATTAAVTVTNSTFDSDVTGWTIDGGTWVWDNDTDCPTNGNGCAYHAAFAESNSFSQTLGGIVSGTAYQLILTIKTLTAGSFVMSLGTVDASTMGLIAGSETNYQTVLVAGESGSVDLTFNPDTAWEGSIDSITVNAITPSTGDVLLTNDDGSDGIELRAGGSSLDNIYIGLGVGEMNTTGNSNVAIGADAFASNTSGYGSTAIGNYALNRHSSGGYNTAMGDHSLTSMTNAWYNTSVGTYTMDETTTGDRNSAFGNNALRSNLTGKENTGIGSHALISSTTADFNTAIGRSSFSGLTVGNINTALGYRAGQTESNDYNVTTATGTLMLGADTGFADTSQYDYATAIGYRARVGCDNCIVLGGTGADAVNVGVGLTSPSEKLHLTGGTFLQSVTGGLAVEGTMTSADLNGARRVAISGEYAYVVSQSSDSLTVIDISDPTGPTQIGTVTSTELNFAFGVVVAGNYAYVAADGAGAGFLTIIDISDPTNPTQVGYATGADLDGAYDVVVSGKYAYVAAGDTDDFTVIDISDPTTPTQVGNVTSVDLDLVRGVAVSGNYAYVTTTDSLAVIDISDPTTPTQVGNVTSVDLGGAYDVTVSGRYAYVTAGDADAFTVIDISDPTTPTQVGNVTSVDLDLAMGMFVSGNYAYVASGFADALTVIDISDPTNPTQVTTITSLDLDIATDVVISGKYAYVTAYSNRFTVVDITGIDVPAANIGSLAASAIFTSGSADISGNLYVRNGVNVGPGGLYVDAGEVSFDGNSGATAFRFGQRGTGDILSVFDGSIEVLTVLDGGNVGIGTSSPNEQLEITGNFRIPTTTASTGTVYMGSQRFIHSYGGNTNLFAGQGAGNFTMSQAGNTGIGFSSLSDLSSGQFNVALGSSALTNDTSGSRNIAVGYNSMWTNSSSTDNTALGHQTLMLLASGAGNVAIGSGASDALTSGTDTIAIGLSAMGAATSGTRSIAIGMGALSDQAGDDNIAIGGNAMNNNDTGDDNIAMGYGAMMGHATTKISGYDNVSLGRSTMYDLTSGRYNVAIGVASLLNITSGNSNIAFGDSALDEVTGGSNNISFGTNSGGTITTGTNNIFIGNSSDATSAALTNAIAIGYQASVTASNSMVLGATGVNSLNVGIGLFSPLTTLDVAGNVRTTGKATAVLTGDIDPTASTAVVGVGTLFATELVVGDRITVNAETRTVTAITDNLNLTVDMAFTDTANDTSPDVLYAIATVRDSNNKTITAINDLGQFSIGTTSPYSPAGFHFSGDRLVDSDGSAKTVGRSSLSHGATLTSAAGQDICTDSLTDPTAIRLDLDADCANNSGTDGTYVRGTDATAATVAVDATWAFDDNEGCGGCSDGDSTYQLGEDLFIDTGRTLVHDALTSMYGDYVGGGDWTNIQDGRLLVVHSPIPEGSYGSTADYSIVFSTNDPFTGYAATGLDENGDWIFQSYMGKALRLNPLGNKVIFGGVGVPYVGIANLYPTERLTVGAGDLLIEGGKFITPYGGFGRYENLLTYSEQFDDAAWTKTNANQTINSTTYTAPDDANTAERHQNTSGASVTTLEQTVSATAGEKYTFSVWTRGHIGSLSLSTTIIDDGTTPASTTSTYDNSTSGFWSRRSVTHTASAGTTQVTVNIEIPAGTTGAYEVFVWGAQLENASEAGQYIRTEGTAQTTPVTGFLAQSDGPHIFANGDIGIGTASPTNFRLEVVGDVGPGTDDTFDLGSSTLRWQDLYLGPASLHIGTDGDEAVISYDTTTDTLDVDKNISVGSNSLTVSTGNISTPLGGIGGYMNALKYSEAFNQVTVWVPTNTTVTNNNTTAPNGLTVAERISGGDAGDGIKQTVNPTPLTVTYASGSNPRTWTGSIWLKASSGTPSITLKIDSTGVSDSGTASHTISSTWQRYSVTHTYTSGTGNPIFEIVTDGNSVYVWGAQLDYAPVPRTYIRTASNYAATPLTGASAYGIVGNGPLTLTGDLTTSGTDNASAPTTARGALMMWIPKKAAFRAGSVSGTEWSGGNVGSRSFAIGSDNMASGLYSFAGGNSSNATQWSAFAFGGVANATGQFSVAMGSNPAASGTASIAMGSNVSATAGGAVALGSNITTSASYAMTLGFGVSGASRLVNNTSNSLAIGFNSTVPTLYIGASNGTVTTGSVGVGATTNLSSFTVKQRADETDIGGTTTASASTTITGSGTTFAYDLGIGDRISLSSAASTYATVTAIANNTSLTVDTALGDGTSQTINVKHSILRVDNASDAVQFVVNDQGQVLPGTDDTYDLGSSAKRWQDLYLGPASLHIGTDGDEAVISYDTTNDRVNIDQDISLVTGKAFQINGVDIIRNTGTDNVFVGEDAGLLTTAARNTAVGSGALRSNILGTDNVVLGFNAHYAASGYKNTAVGAYSLYWNTSTGTTGVGYGALTKNTSGAGNTAVGYQALDWNATGASNTAIGYDALTNSVASNNTAVGRNAMYQNIGGTGNTAVGYIALQGNDYGAYNVAVGYGALSQTTSSGYNVGLGYRAGDTNTTGASNTFIGDDADASVNNLTNVTAIGANALVSASNSLVLGSGANVGIGSSSPISKLTVSGGDTLITDGNLVSPFGGIGTYENILRYSEQLNQSSFWTVSGVTVTANNTLGPDDETTADRLSGGGAGAGIRQTVSGPPMTVAYSGGSTPKTWTGSVWLKASSGTPTITLEIDASTTADLGTADVVISTDWQRYEVTHTFTTGSGWPIFGIETDGTTVYVWGAQLEYAPSPGVYVRTEGEFIVSPDTTTSNHGLVGNGSLLFAGVQGETPAYGQGTRLMWIPEKAAFRAGYASSTEWDEGNIGDKSFAVGYRTKASASYTFAAGNYSTATALGAIALGNSNIASGGYSVAIGTSATASKSGSIAIGTNVGASGDYSVAMGYQAGAGSTSETTAFALGEYAYAYGDNSYALGEFIYINSSTDNAMVLGHGIDNGSNRLSSTISDSLMVGFNSNIPTLFVGPSSGAGTTGNVGIGTTGPDAKLDVFGNTTQLRLTYTNESVFTDFTVDSASDLIIKPSSTGQIKLQPTTDSTDFFQVLDAGGGTPVLNVDATNERVGIGTATPSEKLEVAGSARVTDRLIAGPTVTGGSDYYFGNFPTSYTTAQNLLHRRHTNSITENIYSLSYVDAASSISAGKTFKGLVVETGIQDDVTTAISNMTAGDFYAESWADTGSTLGALMAGNFGAAYLGLDAATNVYGIKSSADIADGTVTNSYGGHFLSTNTGGTTTNNYGLFVQTPMSIGTITTNYGLYINNQTGGSTNYSIYSAGGQSYFADNVGIGDTTPASPLTVGNNDRFQVNANGDLFSDFSTTYSLDGAATDPVGSSSGTSMTVTSATNYTIGNYIKLVNPTTNCAGTTKTCYAKITNVAGNVLTISPSVVWDDTAVVTEWHVPEIGAQNEASPALSGRFGRGYFIDGIVVGNGTTYFTDMGITSTSGFTIDSNNDGSDDFTFSSTGGLSITDDDYIGLGASAGRLEFDDQATDEMNILAANVGIGTSTPRTTLDVTPPAPIALDTLSFGGQSRVDVQGDYAYGTVYGNPGKFYVADVSDPSDIVSMASIDIDTYPRPLAVQGSYAYVAHYSSGYFSVIDISDPTDPAVVGKVFVGSSYGSVLPNGKYVYTTEPGGDTINVIDVSDPSTPRVAKTISGTDGPNGLDIEGDYLYVTSDGGTDDHVTIYDITDPESPVFVGKSATGSSASLSKIRVRGRYAYVTGSSTFKVFDVSDKSAPSEIASITVGASSGNNGIDVQGDRAYVSNWNTQDFFVVDISNPASPSLLHTVDFASTLSVKVQGRYAYLGTGAGVRTFDIGGAYIQQLEAGGIEADSLTISNILSAQYGSFASGLSVARSMNVSGQMAVGGGIRLTPLATPSAPTVTPQGTTGVTTWTYKVTAVSPGGETDASSGGTTVSGNANLDGTNFNRITWSSVMSATEYRIYRTAVGASPTSTGYIGSVKSREALQFDDTGLTATGSAPTVNRTGYISIGVTNPSYRLQLSTDSAAKPTSGTWTVVSDKRLKRDIRDFTDGLATLREIDPVRYTLNGLGGMPDGDESIGIIAQDVKDVIPYTIDTYKDKLNPDDEEETELYTFNASALTFVLINAVKQLDVKMEELTVGGNGGLLGTDTAALDLEGKPIVDIGALQGIDGAWSMDSEGRLAALEVSVENVTTDGVTITQTDDKQTAGEGTIFAGSAAAVVENMHVKENSKIFIAFQKNPRSLWWIDEKHDGMFILMLDQPVVEDVIFDYWFIDIVDERTPSDEEPVVGEPVVEPPVEEPVVEEPIVEEPPVEPPVIEEPVVEEPVVEEPVVEPPAEDPVYIEDPIVEEPVVEPPVEEPVVEEPIVEEPPVEPPVEEPITE